MEIEVVYTRNCPKCNRTISYTGKYALYSRNVANKRNYSCRRCFSSGKNNSFYGKTHSPKNKRLFAINAKMLHTGRKRTDATKHNISVGIKNSNHAEIMRSEVVRNKLRKSNSESSKRMWKDLDYRKKTLDGRIGYKHSEKAKQCMRKSRINYLKTCPFQLQSKSATMFLDELEKLNGKKIGREFELDGRFFDGKIDNILIEVDSDWWHSTQKQKRIDEQKNLIARNNGYELKRFVVNSTKDIPGVLSEIRKGTL